MRYGSSQSHFFWRWRSSTAICTFRRYFAMTANEYHAHWIGMDPSAATFAHFLCFFSFSSTLISIWNVCHFHAFQNNNATVCRIFLAISFRLVLVGSFILSAYWNGFFIRSANMTREEEKERERATRIVSRFHLFYSPQPSHSHLHNISCDFLYILLFLCIFIFSSRLSSGFWCPWFLLCRLSALTNRCLPHIFQCVNAFDVAITTTISPSAEQ